jgi:hypothetical protein
MNATESDGDHSQCGQNEEIEFIVKMRCGTREPAQPGMVDAECPSGVATRAARTIRSWLRPAGR